MLKLRTGFIVGLAILMVASFADGASARLRRGHRAHVFHGHSRSYATRLPRGDGAGSETAGVALGLIGAGIAGATTAGYGYGGYGYGAPGYGGYGNGYYGPGYGHVGY